MPTPLLLPTTVVGSYALPPWLYAAKELIQAGRFGKRDIQETIEDATIVALHDQTEAGVDIISDGEMRRVDFVFGFFDHLTGLQPLEPLRKMGPPLYDSVTWYEVIDKVDAPHGFGLVEEFTFARKHTQKPLKICCAGPVTLATPLRIRSGYKNAEDLLWDLARLVNTELKAVVAAGADYVQIDEPNTATSLVRDLKRTLELFNACVEGVKAKIALHICFGNLRGRPRNARQYSPLFPTFLDARADEFVFEFANREMAECDLWQRFGITQKLGAGVIDVKSFHCETAEEVAARIRRLLQVVPAEQLVINPDCGLWETPRWLAFRKLQAMVEGTKIVRRELQGEERPGRLGQEGSL
jgi:5-methyltetrahydropteroyltriglutamate--homocysteine methyltransferase